MTEFALAAEYRMNTAYNLAITEGCAVDEAVEFVKWCEQHDIDSHYTQAYARWNETREQEDK